MGRTRHARTRAFQRTNVAPLQRADSLLPLLASIVAGCTCESPFQRSEPAPSTTGVTGVPVVTSAAVPVSGPAPVVLYVPDAGIVVPPGEVRPRAIAAGRCPGDMVSVQGRYCIDRYEARLVDTQKARRISPYYHPTQSSTAATFKAWEKMRFTMGEEEYQILPVPAPPNFQLTTAFDVRAVSEPNVVPNGYLSGLIAETACKNAGKRLCTEEEWVTACRGEENRRFPYGETFEPGKCNVWRGVHPATILHGHASLGHLDPRLNHFAYEGRPLLNATGTNQACVSHWEGDGIHDMVGNLDEWIDDEQGAFLGGFYSRNTKEGCQSKITAHPRAYYDYSLGVRCCR